MTVQIRHLADLAFDDLPGRRSADPLAGLDTDGMSVRVVRLEAGVRRSAHRHPHSPEVVYVAEGSGIVWLDGHRERAGTGDVVLVPTGVPHATVPDSSGMLLVCFFPHPDLSDNLEELPGDIG